MNVLTSLLLFFREMRRIDLREEAERVGKERQVRMENRSRVKLQTSLLSLVCHCRERNRVDPKEETERIEKDRQLKRENLKDHVQQVLHKVEDQMLDELDISLKESMVVMCKEVGRVCRD